LQLKCQRSSEGPRARTPQALLFPQKRLRSHQTVLGHRARPAFRPTGSVPAGALYANGVQLAQPGEMRNTFITERDGQWIVTLMELGGSRRQEYVCDSLALAKRWALLLGSPMRSNERPLIKGQPVA
jgi:hypothetical protein